MRVAIVHDWFVTRGGAERVVEEILTVWPEADLFSVVDFYTDADRVHLGGRRPQTTFLQRFPFARTKYRTLLPLMPIAIEQLDMSSYDLVISSSHAVAKGVLTGPDQVHVSYIHSPIRYAWDMQHQYLNQAGLMHGPKAWLVRWLLHRIRLWDSRTGFGVDQFVANSQFIGRRIKKVYGRNSIVVYPPVALDHFPLHEDKDDYYLCASRLVPYKQVALVVEAFSGLPQRRLVVVGEGPELERLRRLASANVEIRGRVTHGELVRLMQSAAAFVFAAEEDFGIMPLEAQACGTPVIAYGRGGSLETVKPLNAAAPSEATGIFFQEQTVNSIRAAIDVFETHRHHFKPRRCRANAERFDGDRFRLQLRAAVDLALAEHASMAFIPPRRMTSLPMPPATGPAAADPSAGLSEATPL